MYKLKDRYASKNPFVSFMNSYGGAAIALGIGIVAVRGCNMAWNNRNVKTESRQTFSHATGILGHHELTLYADGSADLKIYPDWLGHRYMSSTLYEDRNGDGLVDIIRINGPELQMNRLNAVLVRSVDYITHLDEFEKGNRLLKEEKARAQL